MFCHLFYYFSTFPRSRIASENRRLDFPAWLIAGSAVCELQQDADTALSGDARTWCACRGTVRTVRASTRTDLGSVVLYSCVYIYIRVYGRRAARVCCAMCWRPFAHTCAHTRMREVQARLILPDRATCIYCALFRACAFFRDVDRIDDSGKSMLPFALFFKRGIHSFSFLEIASGGQKPSYETMM